MDPLFFKKEEHAEYKRKLNESVTKQFAYGKLDTINKSNFYRRMENKTEREIYLMKKIYNQFWNKKGEEKNSQSK